MPVLPPSSWCGESELPEGAVELRRVRLDLHEARAQRRPVAAQLEQLHGLAAVFLSDKEILSRWVFKAK